MKRIWIKVYSKIVLCSLPAVHLNIFLHENCKISDQNIKIRNNLKRYICICSLYRYDVYMMRTLKLKLETHFWNSFLKLVFETHFWNSFLTLVFETHFWNLFLKLVFETHFWNSFSKLIFETRFWNSFLKSVSETPFWRSLLKLACNSM